MVTAILLFKYFANLKFYRLCDVRFTTVRANIDLSGVTISTRNGDFNPTSLAQAINTDTVNNVVVRAWLDRAGKLHSFSRSVFLSLFSDKKIHPCVLC